MALALGTNSGFVSTAPSTSPSGGNTTNFQVDDRSGASKDTSPASATKITEIGWWADVIDEDVNYEVGLYAADGTGGAPGTLLFSDTTNSQGTTQGWKVVSGLDWAISGSTAYWIAVQVDNTVNATISLSSNNGVGAGWQRYTSGQTTLPSPWGTAPSTDADDMVAIYALWEGAAGPANLKTYNTNATANIKTINTNAIANVKSLNTNV